MRNDLIDQQILDLLRIPAAHRSQDDIVTAITRIAAAANLNVSPAHARHQEQIKLAAIVEFLAGEMGAESHHVSLEISSILWSKSMYAAIRLTPNDTLVGWGNTAEEVLKDLHTVTRDKVPA